MYVLALEIHAATRPEPWVRLTHQMEATPAELSPVVAGGTKVRVEGLVAGPGTGRGISCVPRVGGGTPGASTPHTHATFLLYEEFLVTYRDFL